MTYAGIVWTIGRLRRRSNTPSHTMVGQERECFVEITIAHLFVVPRGMVLGEIVGHVRFAFSPDELVLFLKDSVSDPVDPHIESFR